MAVFQILLYSLVTGYGTAVVYRLTKRKWAVFAILFVLLVPKREKLWVLLLWIRYLFPIMATLPMLAALLMWPYQKTNDKSI